MAASLAARCGMTANMLDASSTFDGSDLDNPNYIKIPEGLQNFDLDARANGVVLESKKSLYGLWHSVNLCH